MNEYRLRYDGGKFAYVVKTFTAETLNEAKAEMRRNAACPTGATSRAFIGSNENK